MPIRVTSSRCQPMPMGCRWCGIDARIHGERWVRSKRWHVYADPTRAQVEARLRVKIMNLRVKITKAKERQKR